MSYNGWANYETWNVMLWMDNEEFAYRAYRSEAPDIDEEDAQRIVRECFGDETPDGVKVGDPAIDWEEIVGAMNEE